MNNASKGNMISQMIMKICYMIGKQVDWIIRSCPLTVWGQTVIAVKPSGCFSESLNEPMHILM